MGLNFDLNMVHVPKPPEVSKLDEYINRLEEEKRKIDGFKRELPLSMLLLKNALAKLEKQAAIQCTEEFEVVELMAFQGNQDEDGGVKRGDHLIENREGMNSVQVCSSGIHFNNKKQETKWRREKGVNPIHRSNGGGAFVPFKEKFGFARKKGKEVLQVPKIPLMNPAPALVKLGSCNSRSNGRKLNLNCTLSNHQQERWRSSRKKQRRNWSAELHKLFIHALDQLGGSRVATPKLIKEAMKVDGLTCDEIKSHLQKYRIHLQSPANNLSGPENRPGDCSNTSLLQYGSSQTQRHVPSGKANSWQLQGS